MNISGNINAIKASYELLPGGVDPINGASETARKMGAGREMSANPGLTVPYGRYDTLEISGDYLANKGDSYTDFPVKYCDMSESLKSFDTQMITPEKLARAYHKANKSLMDTQIELLDNTVAGRKGTNIHNRPDDF
jgi:hypothetical protein